MSLVTLVVHCNLSFTVVSLDTDVNTELSEADQYLVFEVSSFGR